MLGSNTEDRHVQHLTSRAHNGGAKIPCPFCNVYFATASGVAHHLEGGACSQAQGLNRDEMYRFIRRKDPNGLITEKLIGWHGTPSYEATSRTWNGCGYACYFCTKDFSTLAGLNQHLKSPARKYIQSKGQRVFHKSLWPFSLDCPPPPPRVVLVRASWQ